MLRLTSPGGGGQKDSDMHVVNLPDWAIERGRALNDFPTLSAGRTVLVNIDMQNVFVAEDGVFACTHARDIVPVVNHLAAAMRARLASDLDADDPHRPGTLRVARLAIRQRRSGHCGWRRRAPGRRRGT